jgi:ketosteroid isomerase-like protein
VALISSEEVQQAYDAAAAGDIDPLVGLLDPEIEWRGMERGHLWWRKAPA